MRAEYLGVIALLGPYGDFWNEQVRAEEASAPDDSNSVAGINELFHRKPSWLGQTGMLWPTSFCDEPHSANSSPTGPITDTNFILLHFASCQLPSNLTPANCTIELASNT